MITEHPRGQHVPRGGPRTQAAFAIGGTNDLANTYTFDNLGRMVRVDQAGVQGGYVVAPKRVDFAYDSASQPGTVTRYANLGGTQLVVTSTSTFDNGSRLTALAHVKGGSALAGYTWTYDGASRITQFVSTTDGTANYTYLCPCQLGSFDFDRFVRFVPFPQRRWSQGTGWCSFSHKSMAA